MPARRSRRKKKLLRTLDLSAPVESLDVSETSLIPLNPEKWSAVKYVAKSGLDAALSWLWGLAGGGLLLLLGAVSLFLWSDESKWFFQWIRYLVAFSLGVVSVVAVIAVLAGNTIRRKKSELDAEYRRFISTEKGYLDHKAELMEAVNEFGLVLGLIGKAIVALGEVGTHTAGRLGGTERLPNEKQAGAQRAVAAEAADRFIEISIRFDSHLGRLNRVLDVLEESGLGYVSWLASDPQTNNSSLESIAENTKQMLSLTESSIEPVRTFLRTQEDIRGISQELNTAINLMVNSTSGVIRALERSTTLWGRIIKISGGVA